MEGGESKNTEKLTWRWQGFGWRTQSVNWNSICRWEWGKNISERYQRVSNCWDWKKGIGNGMLIQNKWHLGKNLAHIKLRVRLDLRGKAVWWIKCGHGSLAVSPFRFSRGFLNSGTQLIAELERLTCSWWAASISSMLGVSKANVARPQRRWFPHLGSISVFER